MSELDDLEEIDLKPERVRQITPKMARAGWRYFTKANNKAAMLPKWKRQLRAGNKRSPK